VSGYLHAKAALPPTKEPAGYIGQEAQWAPESVLFLSVVEPGELKRTESVVWR
jgi:hypothetical protein